MWKGWNEVCYFFFLNVTEQKPQLNINTPTQSMMYPKLEHRVPCLAHFYLPFIYAPKLLSNTLFHGPFQVALYFFYATTVV